MKTNKKFDIVPYIVSIGLAIAMLIQTAYLYKLEIRYVKMRETITELTLTTVYLTENIDKLDSKLNEHIEAEVAESEEVKEETKETTETKESISSYIYDYDYVLRVVAAESRGEPIEGQMGVAQCIRETSKATGMSPERVVKQPNQYADPVSMSAVTDSVREACERVFINGESVTDEPIRYFYSTRGGFVSNWHENSLTYVMTIGNHKFFKAK